MCLFIYYISSIYDSLELEYEYGLVLVIQIYSMFGFYSKHGLVSCWKTCNELIVKIKIFNEIILLVYCLHRLWYVWLSRALLDLKFLPHLWQS